jgi:hypothetical protein
MIDKDKFYFFLFERSNGFFVFYENNAETVKIIRLKSSNGSDLVPFSGFVKCTPKIKSEIVN